jgi:hypothetical protein
MKTKESKDYSPADYHSRRFKVCDLPQGLHDLEEVEILVTYTGEGSARKGIAVDNVVVPLFKAAPDLLAALRAIQARIQGVWDDPDLVNFGGLMEDTKADVLDMAQAAIARATGEEVA